MRTLSLFFCHVLVSRMSPDQVQLREFDAGVLVDARGRSAGKSVLIVGKRATGKTHLVRDLIESARGRVEVACVVSCTERHSPFLSAHAAADRVFHAFDDDTVRRLRRSKDARQASGDGAIVVLDDCLLGRSDLARVGDVRTHHDTLLVTLPLVFSEFPQGFVQEDFAFLLRDTNQRNVAIAYDRYFRCGSAAGSELTLSFEQFVRLLDETTARHVGAALVVDARREVPCTGNALERLFKYTPPASFCREA